MNTTHTPGPWSAKRCADESGTYVTSANKDMRAYVTTVDVTPGRTTENANASLIAAAPDLLEACKIAEGAFGALASVNNLPSGWHRSVVVPLLAAIAKAEGGAE